MASLNPGDNKDKPALFPWPIAQAGGLGGAGGIGRLARRSWKRLGIRCFEDARSAARTGRNGRPIRSVCSRRFAPAADRRKRLSTLPSEPA